MVELNKFSSRHLKSWNSIFKIVVVIFAILLVQPFMGYKPEVRNSITLVNNTGNEIYASIVWFKKKEQCWTSAGWYKIPPYQKHRTDLADLDLGSNTMYVYAEDRVHKTSWTGNAIFAVDNKLPYFKILFADQIDNKKPTRKFSMQTVGQGDQEYIFK